MTASALPALQLRDIHIPAAAPFWPPAPGWWLIGFAILLLLAWAGALAWRRRRLLLARRRIVDALAELEADFTRERSGERLGRISLLLRRLALSRYPRERVAGLTGAAWLRFLDESGGNGQFANGPGRVLAAAPYQRAIPRDMDIEGFSTLVRAWVETNTRSVS
jgi:hypothetical protein